MAVSSLVLACVLAGRPAPTAVDPAPAVASASPASAPEVAAPRMRRRTARGVFAGGATALFVTWGGAALVASIQLDSDEPESRRVGRALAVPFAGPFVAAAYESNGRTKAAFASIGVYQLASAALLTTGAVSLHRNRRYDGAQGRRRQVPKTTAVTMLATGIAASTLTWGLTFGLSRDAARRGDPFAQRLGIPVVGGYLAAAAAPSHQHGFAALTTSTIQVAGFAVATAGTVLLARRRARRRNLTVMPVASPDRAGVVVAARF